MIRHLKNNNDFETRSRIGDVDGVTPVSIVGHAESVGTTLRYLHHRHDLTDLDIDTMINTPSVVKVSSSSALDTSPSGSGARTARLIGIDAAGDEVSEIITLNGQTAVNSVNTYRVIHELEVQSAGSGGSNAGTLYVGTGVVTTGVPASKNNTVEIGTNLSRTAVYMVPNGKQLVLRQIVPFSGDSSKTMNFDLTRRKASTGLWYEEFDVHTETASFIPVESYEPFGPGDVIAFRCTVNNGTATITICMDGDLVQA